MAKSKEKHKNKVKESGITLVALVVTIIVLLILAGVTLNVLVGDSGILSNAEKAKEQTALANAKEQVQLAVQVALTKGLGTVSKEKLEVELSNLVGAKKYTLSEGKILWKVTIGEYEAYVSENGSVEEPIINPYDKDEWTYAWTYTNAENKWSDMITAGNSAEGDIVAKFYATENEITPPSFEEFTFLRGTEYHLVIEGEGDMGATISEEDAYGWNAPLFEYINTGIMPSEPLITPYVTEIVICDGITNIGAGAFAVDISLNKISISNSVTSIGDMAFSNCTSLTSVTIPSSVKGIGEDAFSFCENLTSVTIPNSVESIGNYAFSYCENLTSVTIPNSVESIGNYAFSGCENLTSVTIPSSVKSIGEDAFSFCENLTSVTIPNSVESIGISAFRCCANLAKVTILSGVTSIGEDAFSSCENLTSVTIPNSVKNIGAYSFYLCTNLKSIIYQGTQTEWNEISKGTSWNSTNLTTIVCTDGNITL